MGEGPGAHDIHALLPSAMRCGRCAVVIFLVLTSFVLSLIYYSQTSRNGFLAMLQPWQCNCTSDRTQTHNRTEISDILRQSASRVFSQKGLDLESENYVLIMQTFQRMKVLPDLLTHYCELERLEKIILLWNDVATPVPDRLKKIKCKVPLLLLKQEENRMTNRFKLRPEITTDG